VASIVFAVQKAVDAAIAAPMAAFSPAVPVFDHAPVNQAFPFVVISRAIGTPDNLLTERITRVQVTLTVFSDFNGQEQCLQILDAIDQVLDEALLTLSDGKSIRCDLERADTVRDADGVTFMGSAIYAVLVKH
jgi:hypothetical protein